MVVCLVVGGEFILLEWSESCVGAVWPVGGGGGGERSYFEKAV